VYRILPDLVRRRFRSTIHPSPSGPSTQPQLPQRPHGQLTSAKAAPAPRTSAPFRLSSTKRPHETVVPPGLLPLWPARRPGGSGAVRGMREPSRAADRGAPRSAGTGVRPAPNTTGVRSALEPRQRGDHPVAYTTQRASPGRGSGPFSLNCRPARAGRRPPTGWRPAGMLFDIHPVPSQHARPVSSPGCPRPAGPCSSPALRRAIGCARRQPAGRSARLPVTPAPGGFRCGTRADHAISGDRILRRVQSAWRSPPPGGAGSLGPLHVFTRVVDAQPADLPLTGRHNHPRSYLSPRRRSWAARSRNRSASRTPIPGFVAPGKGRPAA